MFHNRLLDVLLLVLDDNLSLESLGRRQGDVPLQLKVVRERKCKYGACQELINQDAINGSESK